MSTIGLVGAHSVMGEKAFPGHRSDIIGTAHDQGELSESLARLGNERLLSLPRACVLNSRKPRTVKPHDRWLAATRACVDAAAAGGYAMVSSLGAMPYDWVSFLAAKRKLPLIVVADGPIPARDPHDSYIRSGMGVFPGIFDPRQTLIVSPFSENSSPGRKLRGPIRDALVASLSNALWVAEIRGGGVMEKAVSRAVEEERRVTVFRPDTFDSQTAGNRRLLDKGSVSAFAPALRLPESSGESDTESKEPVVAVSASIFEQNEYLFHYTRACPGPWPSQSWADYLSALDNAEPGASHSGRDTLLRIVRELRIRGGSRLIRGGQPMVSLTERKPQEMTELIAWNRSLVRWSFEPYGVAIRKNALKRMGARRVIYACEDEYKALSPEDRPFFQLHNPPRTDWSREKEWRVRGDVDLSVFTKDEVILLAPQEALPWTAPVPFGIFAAPFSRGEAETAVAEAGG